MTEKDNVIDFKKPGGGDDTPDDYVVSVEDAKTPMGDQLHFAFEVHQRRWPFNKWFAVMMWTHTHRYWRPMAYFRHPTAAAEWALEMAKRVAER